MKIKWDYEKFYDEAGKHRQTTWNEAPSGLWYLDITENRRLLFKAEIPIQLSSDGNLDVIGPEDVVYIHDFITHPVNINISATNAHIQMRHLQHRNVFAEDSMGRFLLSFDVTGYWLDPATGKKYKHFSRTNDAIRSPNDEMLFKRIFEYVEFTPQ